MTQCYFLTGITGSVGSWIARQLLEEGHSLIALVRAPSPAAARKRVSDVLEVLEAAEYRDRVTVHCGDVGQPGLGLLPDHLADVDMIVHCAAYMEFSDDAADRLHHINVAGTAHVLDLAEARRIPVAYVSTAYIAGRRTGRVYEHQIDEGQAFHNPYEATKCRSEVLVQQWSARTGLPVTVFRPSIVVGDSRQGRIVNFDGLYKLFRVFDSVTGVWGVQTFRIPGDPRVTKNIVPVDYVAKVVGHILRTGRPGTYHVTASRPVVLSALRDICRRLLNVPGAQLVTLDDFEKTPPTRLERMYQEASLRYQPYLFEEPVFDRSCTDAALEGAGIAEANIDEAFVSRLLDYARRSYWGKRHPVSQRKSVDDQTPVDRYFSQFLAGKQQQTLLPNLKGLSATCGIVIREFPQRRWALDIQQGRLVKVSCNGLSGQCTFTVDLATFARIVSGRLTPQRAFFQQKIDVAGDMEVGMKLATVLAGFFQQWPYDMQEV